MHISQRQPLQSVARFADANGIRNQIVDGNNLLHVEEAAGKLIEFVRSGQGPAFIEAITYRQYGHVDWREDIDVGVNRSSEDLAVWKNRDPIRRLSEALTLLNPELESVIENQIREFRSQVDSAWSQAESDPFPSPSTLLGTVYSVVSK
jgi:pyruvate dehydrogenase E1 component alpha subunit